MEHAQSTGLSWHQGLDNIKVIRFIEVMDGGIVWGRGGWENTDPAVLIDLIISCLFAASISMKLYSSFPVSFPGRGRVLLIIKLSARTLLDNSSSCSGSSFYSQWWEHFPCVGRVQSTCFIRAEEAPIFDEISRNPNWNLLFTIFHQFEAGSDQSANNSIR